ncbi:hypothetical protein PsorP6_009569 [Peronosclerospora sorghi]|uniref:Uncharacterized protein n=1 Tax=Peronosclerospora sorghi TaxID=230839 RepID=A0ACC0VZY1_9STRA|nr:hypothetical protein PsorP6_009569 [Peronosclerospora sorghi]
MAEDCMSDGNMSEINASASFESSVASSVWSYSVQQSGEESADERDQDPVNGEKRDHEASLSEQETDSGGQNGEENDFVSANARIMIMMMTERPIHRSRRRSPMIQERSSRDYFVGFWNAACFSIISVIVLTVLCKSKLFQFNPLSIERPRWPDSVLSL